MTDVWGWVEEEPAEPTYLYANHQRFPLPNTSFPIHINRLNSSGTSMTHEYSIPFNTASGPEWYDGTTGGWGGWGYRKREIIGSTAAGFFVVKLPDPDDVSTWYTLDPSQTAPIPTGLTGMSQIRYMGATGKHFYYTAIDPADSRKKLYIHDAMTFALDLTLGWDDFSSVLEGDVTRALFSPSGNYLAVQLVQTGGTGNTHNRLRVFSRQDGSLVYEATGDYDIYWGWSQDDAYLWKVNGSVVDVVDTETWTIAWSATYSDAIPHTLSPVIADVGYFVGSTSSFGADSARGVMYNFDDLTVYEDSFAGGSFSHSFGQDGVDFTPNGEFAIVCCDNINGTTQHAYDVDSQTETGLGGAGGIGGCRTRAFY